LPFALSAPRPHAQLTVLAAEALSPYATGLGLFCAGGRAPRWVRLPNEAGR
jgi:hypothetical protein